MQGTLKRTAVLSLLAYLAGAVALLARRRRA
jgi:hypothetical protein